MTNEQSDDGERSFTCKTPGCDLTVVYRPRPVLVWEYRPSSSPPPETVYLTCDSGHTHPYAP